LDPKQLFCDDSAAFLIIYIFVVVVYILRGGRYLHRYTYVNGRKDGYVLNSDAHSLDNRQQKDHHEAETP
jgi:hypothetical protein